MIRTRFSLCSKSVKVQLFNTYFSNIYCCSLWQRQIGKSHSVRVAHNDALRIIFGIPRYSSASENFVDLNLQNIDHVLKNSVNSLQQRLKGTKNKICEHI